MNEYDYLKRFVFLESIAGVPGMVAAMLRHTRSLRTLHPDGGWIHHLLEEAENERMHLFMFLHLWKPGFWGKALLLAAQAIFINGFGLMYVFSPRVAHRFVGYLEEEAVKTYTSCINELDAGKLPNWTNMAAPSQAIKYWDLPENGKIRDMLLAIRADEVMHGEVNHYLGKLKTDESVNLPHSIILEQGLKESVKTKSSPEKATEDIKQKEAVETIIIDHIAEEIDSSIEDSQRKQYHHKGPP